MASNDHKSAAELEREVEMQRNRVSDTIDEIQDRLSPGQIVDQLMSYTKGGAGDFAQNMGKSMMANPLAGGAARRQPRLADDGQEPDGRHRRPAAGTAAGGPANYHPPYYDGLGNQRRGYANDAESRQAELHSGLPASAISCTTRRRRFRHRRQASDAASAAGDAVVVPSDSAGDAMGQAKDALRGAGEQLSSAPSCHGRGSWPGP